MKTAVVTATELARDILKILLSDFHTGDQIIVASGGDRSSAESLARTYLLDGRAVALVLDADTRNPDRIAEQHLVLSESLREVSATGRFKVLLAVPELEEIFFEAPGNTALIFHKPLPDEQWLRSRYEPRKVLAELICGTPAAQADATTIQKALSPDSIARLRNSSLIFQLRDFLATRIKAAA